MSQLKAVLYRSLQKRTLGFWEKDGVMSSGHAPETVALDEAFVKLKVNNPRAFGS